MQPLSKGFISKLRCPKSGSSLQQVDTQLASTSTHTESTEHYPIINGIPWLNKNPLHSMVDWSVKLNHFNQVLSEEVNLINNELKSCSEIVKPRLQTLCKGKQNFIQQVNELVSPVLKAKVASKPVYDALTDRVPHTQNLLAYEANLYRDWVWGEQENRVTADFAYSMLQQTTNNEMLVIGAGACRLAYDLHQKISLHSQNNITVANDINPLLLFAANQILFGPGLTIGEFPPAPKTDKDIFINHEIPACHNPPENFHLLFSDAATPALQAESFDTIVTPWVIDIQAHELSEFMRALNHYLPIGGQWINFGSLVFNQKKQAMRYSLSEIKQLAKVCGFEIEIERQIETPYLKSPYNAGYRMENITGWRAKKIQHCKHNPNLQVLPHWLTQTELPIPKTKEIQAFAFTHNMYADLASLIDGKLSLQQIAQKLAKEQAIDKAEALAMLKKFYLQLVQQKL
ncbi:hypothetical protein ACUR5C_11020 [Aliikangiella sp. IMCC44653]